MQRQILQGSSSNSSGCWLLISSPWLYNLPSFEQYSAIEACKRVAGRQSG
jgi:hypothetical protein